MTYQVQVVDRTTRINRLAQAKPTGHVLSVKFRGKWVDMPCNVVSLDTPIYRMRNIRTRVKQKAYILDHGVAENFFKDGGEDVSAQRVQHDFLVELAKAGDGGSITKILEQEHAQTQPLLATSDGVIVNGNRRLAAMRELFSSKPTEHSSFEHVELALLPDDAKEDDLSEIETDLQIAPEGKLEYGWVEEALGLREQLDDLGWDIKRARSHWKESEDELNRRLAQLDLASEYLASIGHPERYELVRDDDLAFQAFLRNQKGRSAEPPAKLQAEKRVAFALINRKANVAGRVYSLTGSIGAITEKVLVDPGLAVPSATDVDKGNGQEAGDPLAGLPAETDSVPQAALDFLEDQDNWEAIADAAEQAFTDMKAAQKQSQRSTKFQSDAARLNAMVAGMSLSNADLTTMPTASAQLVAAVQGISDWLMQVVKEHPEVRGGLDADALQKAKQSLEELLRTE